jgi:hypothetical protein
MSKPTTRRAVRRTGGLTIVAGGTAFFLVIFPGQAYAATSGQPSVLSGLTGTVSGVLATVTEPVTGALGSIVNSVSEPLTGGTPAIIHAPADQATGVSPSVHASAPAAGQTSPATAPSHAEPPTTKSVNPTGSATSPIDTAGAPDAVTPTASTATRSLVPAAATSIGPAGTSAKDTASHANAASAAGADLQESTLGTGAGTPGARLTPKARASAATPGSESRVSAEPNATPSHRPTAGIAMSLSGMPRWLLVVLVGIGLLAAAAFATEPIATLAKRRRRP